MWVLSFLGYLDGIVVVFINALHILLCLGAEDERTLLEIETGRFGNVIAFSDNRHPDLFALLSILLLFKHGMIW